LRRWRDFSRVCAPNTWPRGAYRIDAALARRLAAIGSRLSARDRRLAHRRGGIAARDLRLVATNLHLARRGRASQPAIGVSPIGEAARPLATAVLRLAIDLSRIDGAALQLERHPLQVEIVGVQLRNVSPRGDFLTRAGKGSRFGCKGLRFCCKASGFCCKASRPSCKGSSSSCKGSIAGQGIVELD
jgi:hypothetical protein